MSYRRIVPGILLRHVLEHNYKWPVILQNALEDFTVRMVIVLHIPLSRLADQYLNPAVFPGRVEVPNIQLCKRDFMVPVAPYLERMETLNTGELMFYLQK